MASRPCTPIPRAPASIPSSLPPPPPSTHTGVVQNPSQDARLPVQPPPQRRLRRLRGRPGRCGQGRRPRPGGGRVYGQGVPGGGRGGLRPPPPADGRAGARGRERTDQSRASGGKDRPGPARVWRHEPPAECLLWRIRRRVQGACACNQCERNRDSCRRGCPRFTHRTKILD
jgi:hypothetical protein